MPRAVFWVSVEGTEITSSLAPILKSITISDSDGGKSDTLELELDDQGGQIEFPATNAPIEAGIAYEEDDGTPKGPPVQFSGKVDKPRSDFSRGGGLDMTISAKSADVKGKAKQRQGKHHDKGKLSEVAKKFGDDAGVSVRVADAIDVERDYWSMQDEDFLFWGARVAREVGATFKVRNSEAIFAERSAGTSLDGDALSTIQARAGEDGNLINASLSPVDDLHEWKTFRTRWYDPKDAKWKTEDVQAEDEPEGEVVHSHRFASPDQDTANRRSRSNSKESDREQGGGSVTIDGEPSAQAEALCIISGVRPGIDGTYRIKKATHKLARSGGYTTTLELTQPSGEAGKDTRGSSTSSSGSSSTSKSPAAQASYPPGGA